MGGLFGRPDYWKCLCDCGNIPCRSCCLPMRFDIPEYPSGLMTDASFSISGCTVGNNGLPQTFVPRGATVECPEGQSELVYDTGYWIQPVVILYPIDEPNIFGDCPSTPCGSIIRFYLECTGRYLESEDLEDTPCNRIWLWAGANGSRQLAGGVYDDWPGKGSYANPDVTTKWLRIAPSSCVCSGGAEGAALIFPLELAFDNPDATVGVNGDCAGRTIGACVWSCSGTLTI
jgi:hypothetical protein